MTEPGNVETETLSFGRRAAEGAGAAGGLVTVHAPDLALAPAIVKFSGREVVLGREPPPGGVRLPFASVSRVHARIVPIDGALVVDDLESRNGTFVDRRRVSRRASLQPGDRLRVGEVVFKVVGDDVDEYGAFPLDGVAPSGPLEPLRGGLLMSRIRLEVTRSAPGDRPLLVTGETGTGKELVSRAVHSMSGRTGALAAVNCAAIPPALLESELFGYRRGAFTGADRDRIGLVKSAEGGTLFLDEIGDMPLDAQAKLLRLLESKEVMPLGSHKAERVDVRVVCATHRDLPRMVRDERFRADLYARIGGHTISLPALRERPEDIHQLVHLQLSRGGAGAKKLGAGFMLALVSWDWPFNVRELVSTVERAVLVSDGPLEVRHLPPEVAAALEERAEPSANTEPAAPRAAPSGPATAPSADDLRRLLLAHDGNVSAVARELGKDRTQIHRWLKRYGISLDDVRG